MGVMKDPTANALCFMKIGEYLETAIVNQIQWAIDMLGVSEYWRLTKNPYVFTYATGQKIYCRGCDNPAKVKSIKLVKGVFRYVWFEELDQFSGAAEIRSILQSVTRGSGEFYRFYSYNPPRTVMHWVNAEALERQSDPDTYIHHSSYLDVPSEWIPEQLIKDAERLKERDEMRYRHEYLGEITGTGGSVFYNVRERTITDEEIQTFGFIRRGIDWGFAVDPVAYGCTYYDRPRNRLFIYHEFYSVGADFETIAAAIKAENKGNGLVRADSAEPRSNAELAKRGINITGVKKGPGSVEHGIKWLQALDEIVIDSKRCPNAFREFSGYEYEQDRHGNFKSAYPDKENHCLTGDTLVDTVNGQYPIAELVGKTIDVYCYDEVNKKSTISKGFDVRQTRQNAIIYEIELEDGRIIKATADHPVYTQSGWKIVGELTDSDSILDIKVR